MKALVVGAGGLVGKSLVATAPDGIEVIAVDRNEVDVTNAAQIHATVGKLAPDVIINCAGYVAVDQAEKERDAAWAVNAAGPRHLAAALAGGTGRLIHISTNYVFDGRSSVPYGTEDVPEPINHYGVSKRAGEVAALEVLGTRASVVRTSWVYGLEGRSFFHTILRVLKEKRLVRVVDDQLGTPTSGPAMSRMLWKIAREPQVHGMLHWTDAGVASWYDFAAAIAENAIARGLVPVDARVEPVGTSEFPTPAPRPMFGVLDKRSTVAMVGVTPAHWRDELARFMKLMG